MAVSVARRCCFWGFWAYDIKMSKLRELPFYKKLFLFTKKMCQESEVPTSQLTSSMEESTQKEGHPPSYIYYDYFQAKDNQVGLPEEKVDFGCG